MDHITLQGWCSWLFALPMAVFYLLGAVNVIILCFLKLDSLWGKYQESRDSKKLYCYVLVWYEEHADKAQEVKVYGSFVQASDERNRLVAKGAKFSEIGIFSREVFK